MLSARTQSSLCVELRSVWTFNCNCLDLVVSEARSRLLCAFMSKRPNICFERFRICSFVLVLMQNTQCLDLLFIWLFHTFIRVLQKQKLR